MLAEAADDFCDAMLRSLPAPKDCNYEFTPRFEKKMKRLIYRTNHPVTYRALQRVASFAIVIFIGFMMIFAISPTVRAAVLGWIREQYESFITYYFEDGTSPSDGPTTYYISDFSADYIELSATYDEETGVFVGIYSDPNGNTLYFTYSTIPQNADFFVKKENYEIKQVSVSGNLADFYLSVDGTESNGIIWCDDNAKVVFFISAMLDEDELLTLAESVIPKE